MRLPLAELGVDRIVARIEQLSDLVDAEEGVGVENEDEEEFTGGRLLFANGVFRVNVKL